jgi:hypothetical protein
MDFSDHNSFDRGEKKINQEEIHIMRCWKGMMLSLFQVMQTETTGKQDEEMSSIRKTANL